MFKKMCGFFLIICLLPYANAVNLNNQQKSYTQNGYYIDYRYCSNCKFSNEEGIKGTNQVNDTIQLETEKSYFDFATGDEPDKFFIDAISYKVNRNKSPEEPFIFAMLIKRQQLNYAIVKYYSNNGYGTLTCVPPKKYNNADIKKLLLTKGCQKAIEKFNIPMSISDIELLVRATGSLN